jgi:hypothetical protein
VCPAIAARSASSTPAAICVLHDSPESRNGDVPAVVRAYVTAASPEAVSVHQTSTMPDALAAVFQELVHAYEAEDSTESRLAHDADKIETLLQAREYEAQGRHDTAQWQDSSTAALRTDTAKELADAILATTPTTWWSAFGRSYTELRNRPAARATPARGRLKLRELRSDASGRRSVQAKGKRWRRPWRAAGRRERSGALRRRIRSHWSSVSRRVSMRRSNACFSDSAQRPAVRPVECRLDTLPRRQRPVIA